MVSPSSEAITTTGEEARDQRDGRARRERNEAGRGLRWSTDEADPRA